jgi:hypothetical protein
LRQAIMPGVAQTATAVFIQISMQHPDTESIQQQLGRAVPGTRIDDHNLIELIDYRGKTRYQLVRLVPHDHAQPYIHRFANTLAQPPVDDGEAALSQMFTPPQRPGPPH